MPRLFAALLVVVVACSSSASRPAAGPDEAMPLPPTRDEQEHAVDPDKAAPPGDEQLHVYGMSPKTGPATGGTAIQIRGANFQRAEGVKVFFNRQEGAVTRMIDDEIVVQAPPGIAGQTVEVVLVFEPGASRLALPEGYTYTAP